MSMFSIALNRSQLIYFAVSLPGCLPTERTNQMTSGVAALM
eukprot:COSAG06_NODE_4318_length_4368_cov_2.106114_1_plen_41_part_00